MMAVGKGGEVRGREEWEGWRGVKGRVHVVCGHFLSTFLCGGHWRLWRRQILDKWRRQATVARNFRVVPP
jgi:hypothetical protein